MADNFIPTCNQETNDKFYVYIYMGDDGVPFYVGKGHGDRYKVKRHFRRNMLLKNKIKKLGEENIIVKILYNNLTEEQAFYLEEKYIAGYGRRDLKIGPLCNLTNGGDGSCGYQHTKEAKLKMSEIKKNISDETRRKMGAAHLGKVLPLEQRLKIGKSGIGRKHSIEAKKKISESKFGHIVSEETRKKISEAQIRNRNARRK